MSVVCASLGQSGDFRPSPPTRNSPCLDFGLSGCLSSSIGSIVIYENPHQTCRILIWAMARVRLRPTISLKLSFPRSSVPRSSCPSNPIRFIAAPQSISVPASRLIHASNHKLYSTASSSSHERGPSSSWTDGVAAQAIFGSLGGVFILGFGGYLYHTWYKYSVIKKMAIAFEPGYDPVLVLDSASQRVPKKPELTRPTYKSSSTSDSDGEEKSDEIAWIARREQDLIDQIIHGKLAGQYWLITGPKGTGKFSLIADAMVRNKAEGVAVCDCCDNLEIIRLRLGKCLNFEYAEDYIGGLFSRRDPREGGPLVDIERALNKLEKVAIEYHTKHLRPLVLVFNNIHHLKQTEDSNSLLLQLQQRAESWSQAGIATFVFCSDDHWPYTSMKKNGSRMSVLTVQDLSKDEAVRAIRTERKKLWDESRPADDKEVESLWEMVGGRVGHLIWCIKHKDMIHAAKLIINREKEWLLSRIGLIVDCDDDVMDEQKWASSSLLLLQALVKTADEQAAAQPESVNQSQYPKGIPYSMARQVMTRADFLSQLDHENVISIDTDYYVKPNSIVLLNVIKELCNQADFQERLDSVLERIGDIESLGRTRELTWKSGKDGDGVLNVKIETARLV